MLRRTLPHWYTLYSPRTLIFYSTVGADLESELLCAICEYWIHQAEHFLTHFPSSQPRNFLFPHSDLNTKDSWCIYRPSIYIYYALKKIPIKRDRINVSNELCNVLYILSHSSCFFSVELFVVWLIFILRKILLFVDRYYY